MVVLMFCGLCRAQWVTLPSFGEREHKPKLGPSKMYQSRELFLDGGAM